MPPETVKVSVIVISYNTREMTLECLRALADDMKGMPWELWVVDNASSDGSAEAVKETFPEARVIVNEHNAGFGAANNQAIRQAQGQYLLLVNSDAFVQPGAVEALVSHLDTHPGVAVVGPKLLNPDGSLQQSCYRFPSPVRAWLENLWISAVCSPGSILGDYRRWQHNEQRNVDWVIGACMLVRAEALQSAGLFDERFFMYAEETDWQKRIRSCGWQVHFEPAAMVSHIGGASGAFGGLNQQAFESLDRYQLKHHGRLGLFAFRLAMVVGCTMRVVVWGAASLLPSRRADALVRMKRHLRLACRQSVGMWGRIRVAG